MGPTTPVLISWNGSNGTLPAGLSDKIATSHGNLRINANAAAPQTNTGNGWCSAWYNVETFGPDQEAYFTLTDEGDGYYQAVGLRLSNPGTSSVTGYIVGATLDAGTARAWIYRQSNTSNPQLFQGVLPGTWGSGTKVMGRAIGPYLYLYLCPPGGDWQLMCHVKDSTYAPASSRIGLWRGDTLMRMTPPGYLNPLTWDGTEDGAGDGWFTSWQRTAPDRTVSVTVPGLTRPVLRIRRAPGDVNPVGSGTQRTEAYDSRGDLPVPSWNIHDAWYGTAFYLPATAGDTFGLGYSDPAYEAEDEWSLLWQVHQDDYSAESSPPIGLYVDRRWDPGYDHELYIGYRSDWGSDETAFLTGDANVLGHWLQVAWRVEWRVTGGPHLEVHLRVDDGDWQKAVDLSDDDYSGLTGIGYQDDGGGYAKFGLYFGGTDREQVVYHGGYIRTDSEAAAKAFAEVVPGDGPPPDPGTGAAAGGALKGAALLTGQPRARRALIRGDAG